MQVAKPSVRHHLRYLQETSSDNMRANEESFFSTKVPPSSVVNAVKMDSSPTEGGSVRRSFSNGNWDVWNGVADPVSPGDRSSFVPSPSPSPLGAQMSPKTSPNHSEGKKLLPNNLTGLLVGAVLQSLRQGPKSAAELRRSISSSVAWKGPANILYYYISDTLAILESLGIAIPSTMPVPELQRERIESFSFSPDDLASASRRRSSSAHYCPSPFFARPGPPRPTTASGEVLSTERILNVEENKQVAQSRKEEENKVSIKVANLAPKKMKRKRSESQDAMAYAAAKAGAAAGAYAGAGRRGDVKLPGTFAQAASAIDIDSDNKSTLVGKSVSVSEINDIKEKSGGIGHRVEPLSGGDNKQKLSRDRSETQDSIPGLLIY